MGVNRNKWFLKNVGRHFVTLSYVFISPGKTDAERKCALISGFILEVLGTWFYITAGHVIDEIREGQNGGGQFDRWRLDDQTAGNSFKGAAVPYDFNIKHWNVLRDDQIGLDYAFVPLGKYYCNHLKAGGVVPITKRVWGHHFENYDQRILVGVPAQTVDYQDSIIRAKIVMIPFEPAEAPPGAGRKVDNMFFGKLNFDSPNEPDIKDICGMSGGPIFATKKLADGKLKYWLIGVQSGWYPSQRIVTACPMFAFGVELQKLLKKIMKAQKANLCGKGSTQHGRRTSLPKEREPH